MNKLRIYLYPLVLGLAVVYFQKNFFFHTGQLSGYLAGLPANFFLFSLCSGVAFGFISCPVCGLPLSLALGSTEKLVGGVVFKNILFHSARFLIIFIYAFFGNLLTRGIGGIFENLSFLLGGAVMMIMGSVILGKFKWNLTFLYPRKPGGLNSFFYFLFGASLGFACGFEATGFLIPLWLGAGDSFIVKLTGLLIFSISAVLPVMLMSVLFYFGFKGLISFFKERCRFFLANASGFYLLILGLVFVASFFKKGGLKQ